MSLFLFIMYVTSRAIIYEVKIFHAFFKVIFEALSVLEVLRVPFLFLFFSVF
jgi:hypothetical protein